MFLLSFKGKTHYYMGRAFYKILDVLTGLSQTYILCCFNFILLLHHLGYHTKYSSSLVYSSKAFISYYDFLVNSVVVRSDSFYTLYLFSSILFISTPHLPISHLGLCLHNLGLCSTRFKSSLNNPFCFPFLEGGRSLQRPTATMSQEDELGHSSRTLCYRGGGYNKVNATSSQDGPAHVAFLTISSSPLRTHRGHGGICSHRE